MIVYNFTKAKEKGGARMMKTLIYSTIKSYILNKLSGASFNSLLCTSNLIKKYIKYKNKDKDNIIILCGIKDTG